MKQHNVEFSSHTGNLPPGIHEATWDELVQRYGYTAQRGGLLSGLRAALESLARAGCLRVRALAFCRHRRRLLRLEHVYQTAHRRARSGAVAVRLQQAGGLGLIRHAFSGNDVLCKHCDHTFQALAPEFPPSPSSEGSTTGPLNVADSEVERVVVICPAADVPVGPAGGHVGGAGPGDRADLVVGHIGRRLIELLQPFHCRVLVHDPKVLLLDEPAGNLDPRARIEMRELLKELQRMKKTILISSHILPELADLCNKVGIIEQGELLYSGPVTDIVRRARTGMVVHVGVPMDQQEPAAALLSTEPSVENVVATNGYLTVSLREGIEDYGFVAQRLVAAGYKITLLREEEVNLETAFMRLTKGMVQ